MSDCLFCRIIAGEIPGDVVYENDKVFAFRDINPQAPVHVLIVPKKHMANVLECDADRAAYLIRFDGVDTPRRISYKVKLTVL